MIEEDEKSLLSTDGPPTLSADFIAVEAVPMDVVAVEGIEVTGVVDEPKKTIEYQDAAFALFFVLHLLFVLGVALLAGIPALASSSSPTNGTSSSSSGTVSATPSANPYHSGHAASLVFHLCFFVKECGGKRRDDKTSRTIPSPLSSSSPRLMKTRPRLPRVLSVCR